MNVLDAEQLANADNTKLETDDHDDEPADRRRERSPKPAQKVGQANLDQTGKDRHPEYGRKPAGAGRQHSGADIDRREYRRRQVPRADRTLAHALQYRGD